MNYTDSFFWNLLFIILYLTFICVLIIRYRFVSIHLFTSASIKSILLFIHLNYFRMPGSSNDAYSFFLTAAELSTNDPFFNFIGLSSYFYSWFWSIVFSITIPSELLMSLASICVSLLIIVVSYKIFEKIVSNRKASLFTWILVLYPSLNLYSVLTMREVYITFFVGILIYQLLFSINKKFNPKIFFVSLILTFLHGGFLILFLIYIIYTMYLYFKNITKAKDFLLFSSTFLLIFLLLFSFFNLDLTLPKLRSADKLFDSETQIYYLSKKIDNENAGAVYPQFLKPGTTADLFLLAPVRFIYFIGSPFPWDVRSMLHLIGLIDGAFFMFIFSSFLFNTPSYKRSHPAIRLFFLFLPVLIAFLYGTSNFGTAQRHRLKFIILFLSLFIFKNSERAK